MTPPTCGATSMPCTARKVPMAAMRDCHVSVLASATATDGTGRGAPAMKPLIMFGFTANWK